MHPTTAERFEQHVTVPSPGSEADSPISWEPSLAFLKYAIASQFIGALAFLVALRILVPEQSLRLVGAVLVGLVAVLGAYLLVRGRVRATVMVLAYGLWVIVTAVAFFTGGVRAPVVIVYPVLVLMVGWLISSRAALGTAGLTLLVTFGFLLEETMGVQRPPPATPAALYGVVQIVMTVLSAALIGRLVRSYQNSLAELRHFAGDLARRTQDLEASKAELNRAQAVANIGSWVYDAVDDTVRLSAEACRIFGVSEGITGSRDSHLARTHPQDRGAVERAWQGALRGAPFDREHRIVVAGEVRWVRQKGDVEFAPDGRPLRAEGIAHDITEMKRAEEEMLVKDAAIEASLNGIALSDLGGIVTYVNPAFCRMWGIEPAAALGRPAIDFWRTRDEPGLVIETINRFGRWTGELDAARPNGEVFSALVAASMVRNRAGDPVCMMGAFSDITVIKQHERRLQYIAHYDTLTTLPNRVLLADRLNQAMVQTQRRGQRLAVVYVDLDGFKAINDSHGHDTGDQLLMSLATSMKQALREGDTLARLGGDEFVAVLLDLADVAASEPMLTRLLAAAARPMQVGEVVLQVSASLGITFYPQAEEVDGDQLLRQADQAMYQAKLAGKNRYHLFDVD